MKKFGFVFGALLAIGIIMLPITAAAGGGCPGGGGWSLVPTNAVIPGYDQGSIKDLDHNDDGLVCFKQPASFCEHANGDDKGNGAECGSWVVRDNTAANKQQD